MNRKLTDRRRFSKLSMVKKKTDQEKYELQVFRIHGLAMDFYEEKKVSKADNATVLTTLPPSSHSAINNRNTIKSPDVYLLSEVVDQVLFIRPIRTQQISLAGRPSVHLTQRRGKNKANLLFLLSSYMFDVNSCSFKFDFKRDCFFSYKVSWAIHIGNLRPT